VNLNVLKKLLKTRHLWIYVRLVVILQMLKRNRFLFISLSIRNRSLFSHDYVDLFCHNCFCVFCYAFFCFHVFWRIDREFNNRRYKSWYLDSFFDNLNFFIADFAMFITNSILIQIINFVINFVVTFAFKSIIEIDFENLNNIFVKKQKRRKIWSWK
jgi:hypothetical protein